MKLVILILSSYKRGIKTNITDEYYDQQQIELKVNFTFLDIVFILISYCKKYHKFSSFCDIKTIHLKVKQTTDY